MTTSFVISLFYNMITFIMEKASQDCLFKRKRPELNRAELLLPGFEKTSQSLRNPRPSCRNMSPAPTYHSSIGRNYQPPHGSPPQQPVRSYIEILRGPSCY